MKSIKTNGARLRELREAKHWTQEQVAEISGVATRTIQRAERGESLDANSLSVLAKTFDVELADLVAEETPKTHELLFLPRVTTTSQLQHMVTCHARLEMHDDPKDDTEREAIGALLDALEDTNMIWEDLSPSQRLETGAYLLDAVRALDGTGLRLFAVVAEKDVDFPSGKPVRWSVAHIIITRRDNPSVLSRSESSEEMAVFAMFPIRPKLGM
jgi:transcriptional regulator with XRE-family HTH domain